MTALAQKKAEIEKDIQENRILLYMKGSRRMPQCGFSARVVQILDTFGLEYTTRNILLDDELRQAIKEFSDWPTLPQLYIDGEFVGGCDIVCQLFESGELKKLVEG